MTDEAIHHTGVEPCPSCGGEVWHCSRCGAGLPGISVDSRVLSTAELSALLAVCLWDSRPCGIRDAAIITVVYAAELRREDVVTLDLRHWSQLNALLTIRARDGREEREVTLADAEAEALTRWILTRGPHPGPLFVPVKPYGQLANRRLMRNTITSMLRRRSKQAGIRTARTRDLHYTRRGQQALGAGYAGSRAGVRHVESPRPHTRLPSADGGGAATLEYLPEEELRRLRARINSILLQRGTTDSEINGGPGSQFGKGFPYPEETKLKVVEAVRAGTSPTAVSRMFGIGLDTVKRWVKTAREGRSLRPKRPTGAPPVADPEARRWLATDLERRPHDTLLMRRERLWRATGVEPPASSAIWKQIRLWGFVYSDGRWIKLG